MQEPPIKLSLAGAGLMFILIGGGMFGQAQQAISAGASVDDAGWLSQGEGTTRYNRVRETEPLLYGEQRLYGGVGFGLGLLILGGLGAVQYGRGA